MDYKDYYAVLGRPEDRVTDEIKKAFRKLAREHHPDTKPGDAAAERRFKEVNEANAVLSDPDKRDALRPSSGRTGRPIARAGAGPARRRAGGGRRAGARSAGFGGRRPGGNVRYEFHTTGDAGEFSDFFNVFFGEAPREPARRTGGPRSAPDRRRRPSRTSWPAWASTARGRPAAAAAAAAADGRRPAPAAEATAEITLDEAYHGTTRLVEVEGKRLEVTIPPGADTGTRIRLTGKAPGGGDLVRRRPPAARPDVHPPRRRPRARAAR